MQPVALLSLLFSIRSLQMGGQQNLLLSLLEVLWVKHNATSVMGGASVITPMTPPTPTTSPAASRLLLGLVRLLGLGWRL